MSPAPRWTDEFDAILKDEWSKGTPARQIAEILTAQGFPQTKNGILGRAHRKGLPKHKDASERRDVPPSIIRPDFSKPLAPTGCRYIHGDAAGWQSKWCDAPERPGSSYCDAHHFQCWVKPEKKAEPQPFFVVKPL